MGYPQKRQGDGYAGQRPCQRGIAVDAEHESESGQAALACVFDGPVKVVAEAGGRMQRQECDEQGRARAGKKGDQCCAKARAIPGAQMRGTGGTHV
jgi:hypothetical protein